MAKSTKQSYHSSSSSLPHGGQVREERPTASALSGSKEDLTFDDLKTLLNNQDDKRSPAQLLRPIYWRVTEHIRLRGGEFRVDDLVSQESFKKSTNKLGLDAFFNLLRKAIDTGKKNDRMAVFNYSMCLYYGVNLVMNILQVDFGSLHSHLVVLTNHPR